MPTYEYACQKCEHTFEQFQSMREDPLTKCPECGKKSLKRLVGGGAGLIFKGTGFYITDYRKKTGDASKTTGDSKSASSTSAPAPTAPSSSTSAPSKPAATAKA